MTNQTKHTNGPWTVAKAPSGQTCVISKTTWICGQIANQTDIPLEEAEANARLIAAAPELLEAAEAEELDKAHDALSDLLEDEAAGNDDIREAAISLCEALIAHHDNRRAAIAKATGRAA